MMAARNRPRAGMIKDDPADAHEERNMWNQILTDVKRLKQINAKAADISNQIVGLEAIIAKVDPETGRGRSASLLQTLASGPLHRNYSLWPFSGSSYKEIRTTAPSVSNSAFTAIRSSFFFSSVPKTILRVISKCY